MRKQRKRFVHAALAEDFLPKLQNHCIDLAILDPPYYGIVKEKWDNQWKDVEEYLSWFRFILLYLHNTLKPTASVILFGGTGKHGCHPLFSLIGSCEALWTYRDWMTWKKRRGYGKKAGYLYTREEMIWFTVNKKKDFTFNIPLLDEERGYKGWNKKYPAKSKYKRVSNVWTDIGEIMHPERTAQKPIALMERLINTHSNPGDLVLDPFAGYGTTGMAAIGLDRKFIGCEASKEDALAASIRINKVMREKDNE